MSGIAGIFRRAGAIESGDLERMSAAIAHRGPDGEGSHLGEGVALCHRLLRIPAAVCVAQPLFSEDGNLALVCDGRIYNHAALRRQLQERGHRFSGDGDVEVLLHLYQEKGDDLLDDVNGMFAFALWDGERKRLLLGRDRIGIKPLYYAHQGGRLLFGSEIKAILADPAVPRRVNLRAMSDFFGLSYIFDGETMYEGVMALPPGCTYSVDVDGRRRLRVYWDMEFAPDHPWQEAETAREGLEILRDAVEQRIAGVKPVGIHLSGGIDSSFITSLAAEKDREALVTLSAGFREDEYDERDYAFRAAENARVRHETIEVFPTEESFMDTMLEVIWHVDEPTVSPGIHSFYVLNEFTARFVKVVLGGQGSNELLAGYNRYILADLHERFARAVRHLDPGQARRQVKNTLDFFGYRPLKSMVLEIPRSSAWRALRISSTFAPAEKRRLFSDRVQAALDGYSSEERYLRGFRQAPASTTIDRMMYLDMKGMMPNMLRILDRTCAAFGVEPRTPFLDHRFVEFAAGLSDAAVLRGTESKYILKKMGEGILRHDTIYRDKSGFAAPVTPWLQGHLRRTAREIIFSPRARQRGYFDDKSLESFVERHEKTGKGVWQVWMLLIFELWHRRFIDGDAG